ncbi:hypothetical protein LguiA_009550 [Lonicera macranthoides]
MVAISLYRGNLHRVPDVPRQWLTPTPKISLKDFKILLNRRSRALSRLRSTTPTTSNPNPNPNPNLKQEEGTTVNDNPNRDPQQQYCLDGGGCSAKPADGSEEGVTKEGEVDDKKELDGGDCLAKPVDGFQIPTDAKAVETESNPNLAESCLNSVDEKTAAPLKPSSEINNKADASNDKEKRKREVEEKLQILQARKHSLVQVLKQILNAEEELKRRSSTQGMAVHPPAPLQVDVTNDSGSMTRHATPQMGTEGNLGGDMEGAEADNGSNHNMHSCHLLRMSSPSPSTDSPNRRAAFNAVTHASRATLGIGSSPSRFAPTGQQAGHPPNLPTVSVSGTNYITSSPSPAASGGTSVFRDARLPSPWN